MELLMKTFKEYINETPMINDIDKEPNLTPYDDHIDDKPKRKFISTLKGHKVSKLHTYDNSDSWVNYSKIPAHEFYHHLITNHAVHLHSDYSQSEGAKKVWERLHKMPGIKMQAFDMGERTYSDIHPAEGLNQYYGKGNIRLSAKKEE